MAPPLDLHTLEAAATWYVRLSSSAPNEADKQAWAAWLQASPQHARAWARVEKLQSQWAGLPAEVTLTTLAGVKARRRAVLKTLGLLLAAGGSGWLATEHVPYRAMLADQRTATGQRRHLRLSDESQIDINTDSAGHCFQCANAPDPPAPGRNSGANRQRLSAFYRRVAPRQCARLGHALCGALRAKLYRGVRAGKGG